MKPTDELSGLAQELRDRPSRDPDRPMLLFLGSQCGEAAGVPSSEVMARKVLADLRDTDPKYAEALLPDGEESDPGALVEGFYKLLAGMSHIQRFRVLQPFYSAIPVPLFYQDLATLVSAGYFPWILTTNVDSLLEQALALVGLRPSYGYRLMVLPTGSGSTFPTDESVSGMNLATIIKLHGDLEQTQLPVTADEIEEAVRSQRSLVKGELMGDVVMMGYEFESPPVDDWLARSSSGRLWWVSSERPDPARMGPIEQARGVTNIEGESAEPSSFFGLLVEILLRQPVLQAMKTSFDEFVSSGGQTEPTAPGEDLEFEFLKGQLLRSQVSKRTVEQTVSPGDVNPNAEVQLDYLRRQVADLEDQVRGRTQDRVLELMEEFQASLSKARGNPSLASIVDPDTEAFVQGQVGAVAQESKKGSPNQHVISAAIGAIVVLGQRLGKDVVSPNIVSELAALGPTGWIS